MCVCVCVFRTVINTVFCKYNLNISVERDGEGRKKGGTLEKLAKGERHGKVVRLRDEENHFVIWRPAFARLSLWKQNEYEDYQNDEK
jgi:hypothetical protein